MSSMKRSNRWIVFALIIIVALLFYNRSRKSSEAPVKNEPAKVEPLEGTDLKRVTLTPEASERLGIVTADVRLAQNLRARVLSKVVPYSSVLYDLNGDTWVYTNPENLTFVRAQIVIDYIEGDSAYLSEGPDVKTLVVTVGAAELYGTETGVGK